MLRLDDNSQKPSIFDPVLENGDGVDVRLKVGKNTVNCSTSLVSLGHLRLCFTPLITIGTLRATLRAAEECCSTNRKCLMFVFLLLISNWCLG